ncbi:MAG: ABC transporter permease [Acidobacteria bacterium]|nr:ABC transporter permease [Acidobacteriota bacterium]
MGTLREWVSRLWGVLSPDRPDRELEEELRQHLEFAAEDARRRGQTSERDVRAIRLRAGGITQAMEAVRAQRRIPTIESVVRDVRYGLRQLRLSPGFTIVALLSLALGIGANSAMFQLLNAVRLRPLPVARPAELAVVTRSGSFYGAGWSTGRNESFTFAQYQEISRRQQAFSGLLAFSTRRFNLSSGGQVRYAEGLYVSPNFLEVLGVRPQLGAWPADVDPRDCGREGVLLNDGFWRREFGADPGVIGRTMTLDGRRLPVLAVAPPAFYGVEPAYRFDIAVPLCADAGADRESRLSLKWAWWLTMMGRLEPGWTVERAARHLHEISPAVFAETVPETYRPDVAARYLENRLGAASAQAGVSSLREQYEGALWILLGMTALVLCIACANLANLLLARAAAREREAVLRQALGASRGRLVRQLMCESLILAVAGALIGTWFAHASSRALVAFLSGSEGGLYLPIDLDWRVLGFTIALAGGTCVLFGLGPALRATLVSPASVMHGGRGPTSLADRHTFRRGLVVFQVALSFVLLSGALLFGRSLRNLTTAETGMVTEGVLAATVTTEADKGRRPLLFNDIEDRVRRLPDVAAAAIVLYPPFSPAGWNQEVYVGSDKAKTALAWLNRVSPHYFETMGTPIVAGRDFSAQDRAGTPNVAIVNQAFARAVFGDANPIGARFEYEAQAGEQDPVFTVVGLVGNTKYGAIRESTRLIAFLPVAQDVPMSDRLTVVLRARGAMSSAQAGVEREVASVDPRALIEFKPLDVQIADSLARERLVASLSGGFGALAVVLATLGLYGVMAYIIARRRSEIGVRMALGAGRVDILALVFGEASRLMVIGIVLGVGGSLLVLRSATSLLFGLSPTDPATLAIAAVCLAITGLIAVLLPTRNAVRTDPAVVLRGD